MRPLPWQLRAPGFNGMQWCVLDADGHLVCECDGVDDGQAEAEAIAWAVNGPQWQVAVDAVTVDVVLQRLDALVEHRNNESARKELSRYRAEADKLIHEFWIAALGWMTANRAALLAFECPQPRCRKCGVHWIQHLYLAPCSGDFPVWLVDSIERCAEGLLRTRALTRWLPTLEDGNRSKP